MSPAPSRAAERPRARPGVRPDPARPDRYADAVRARRRELREASTLLLTGPRELRHGLAVARLAASAELTRALAGLERELRDHVERGGGTARDRRALPALAARGVEELAGHLARRWTALVLPGVRRVFVVRGLPPPVAWTPLLDGPPGRPDPLAAVLARPPALGLPHPEPPPPALRAVLTGAAAGGAWRLALLPAAALSAAGLPALDGRVRPAAVGIGLALLAVAARAHRAGAERVRLRSWSLAVVATVRQAGEAEIARRLLEVERLAGAALDTAVARRRAEIDAELRALAPAGRGADP